MDNYHYIVASLPVLTPDSRLGDESPAAIMSGIREQLSAKDLSVLEFLEKGFDAESLDSSFYREALRHSNRFIREYFSFDLSVRNAKVRYLNSELGRPEGQDTLDINGGEDEEQIAVGEFEESAKLDAVLHSGDILSRERGMDDLYWEKIDGIATFDYFNLETVLAFVTKLHIVERWYKLDEETGRRLFKQLVDEVRGTFKGVEFN